MKPRKALVTGGHGFLGQTLVPTLEKAGMVVEAPSSKECDLRHPDSLAQVSEPFDCIFHLAAWTQAGEFCLHHQGEQWVINQQINTNVLNWWKEKQSQARLLLVATSCAYDPTIPLVEENFLRGEPIPSLYAYAMTKRMMHVGALSLRKQYGMEFVTVVPSTLCGPYYHHDGRQMHFIYDVVRKIMDAERTGKPAVLWGDGRQRREILHVEDFVSGILAVLDNDGATGELINLGAGRDFAVRDFATEACRQVGIPDTAVEYDTTRYVGAQSKLLDTAKMTSLVPWAPRGMEECVRDVLLALQNAP